MSLRNVHDYALPVWQRFESPSLAGRLEGMGVLEAQAGSPAARSVLRLSVRMAQGRIEAARFQAYGCPTAIAVGQWLAEQLQAGGCGDRPPEASQIRAALEIGEDKAHCALMGEDVVRALWNQMKSPA